jgi:hypothetical protein
MATLRYPGQTYRATITNTLKMVVSFRQKNALGIGQEVVRHLGYPEWVTLNWDPDTKILVIAVSEYTEPTACRLSQLPTRHNGVKYSISAGGFYNWTGLRPTLTHHYEALPAGKGRVEVYTAKPLRSYSGHRRIYERPTSRNGANGSQPVD